MTRKEFEEWLDSNDARTVWDYRNIPFTYISNDSTTKLKYTDDGTYGTYQCCEDNSKWRIISEIKVNGDRPELNYSLSPRELFDSEENALEWLKNKLEERYIQKVVFVNGDENSANNEILEIECMVCNSPLKINFHNCPTNQKIVYFHCPNCNAELKRKNSNYLPSYEERLKQVLKSDDPFWFGMIDNFIKSTYEDIEKGIGDIENLAKDKAKFNEFSKQITQKKNDLMSVKEEFINVQNTDVDIEEISNKLVTDIKNIKENSETSISALINRKIDSKTMFNIYELTVKKLNEVGLYLNFGKYENQRVGLPFNVPFTKEYVKKITISKRLYNGKYAKGSIFSDVVEVVLKGNNAIIKSNMHFCSDEKLKDKSVLEVSIPIVISEDEIKKLNEIFNEIENEYKPFNKLEERVSISPEYFKYIDVSINNNNYAINTDNKVISELRKLIKYDSIHKTLMKAYKDLLSDDEGYDEKELLNKIETKKNIFNEGLARIKLLFNHNSSPKKLSKENNALLCPNCKQRLMFLEPDGQYLHCNNCEKYYINKNGVVGKETSSPYTRDDVLY